MRRITVILCICLAFTMLSGCSSNHSGDVYFLHAAVFGKNDDGNFELSAILEKLSGNGKEDSYFSAAQSGKDIEEITKKLSDKFKECYFATCEVYIFDDSITNDDLKVIAKAICNSNDYPSKSLVCHVSGTDSKSFTDAIKDEDDMKKLLSQTEDNKVNAVYFLSGIHSEKRIEIPSFTVTNGKIQKGKNKVHFGKDDKDGS